MLRTYMTRATGLIHRARAPLQPFKAGLAGPIFFGWQTLHLTQGSSSLPGGADPQAGHVAHGGSINICIAYGSLHALIMIGSMIGTCVPL